MVQLSALWVPILVSALFVFIASNVLWMLLPFWHRSDSGKLPDEKAAIDALKSAKSGQYIVPCLDWGKATPEEREAMQRGPIAYVLLRNPGDFSMGKTLVLWFLYSLIVSFFVGYLAGHTLAPGTKYLAVFRVVGTAGFLAYGFRTVADAIWYGKPWKVMIKETIDGLIYSLLMAGAFGWLWPH
ncbi:MAG: hypothetical protein ACRD3J_31295 [Thermoanaerobaculia bacterium]